MMFFSFLPKKSLFLFCLQLLWQQRCFLRNVARNLPAVRQASTITQAHVGSPSLASPPVDLLSEEEQMMKETGKAEICKMRGVSVAFF